MRTEVCFKDDIEFTRKTGARNPCLSRNSIYNVGDNLIFFQKLFLNYVKDTWNIKTFGVPEQVVAKRGFFPTEPK